MLSKKYILGVNLKMYMDGKTTHDWVMTIKSGIEKLSTHNIEMFILPSAPLLRETIQSLAGTALSVGSQNCSTEQDGALTGEISPKLLKEIGCRYVLVGHHERRTKFSESNAVINKKILAILANQLKPILCIGETEVISLQVAETEIEEQLNYSLLNVNPQSEVIIAYEPTWSIGAENPASLVHINHMCNLIRKILENFGFQNFSIIYGGTAGEGLLNQVNKSCDGLFLGRRVHNPTNFIKIVKECMELQS